MKKHSKNLKEFVIFMAMAVVLLLPTKTNAQTRTDGFFSASATETYNDRNMSISGDFLGASNQTFGQNEETPLGSGLLIMLAAGAGYVAMRRKRTRKVTTLLLAAVMMLGLTQCRKNTAVIDTMSKNTIDIVINVDNDSRINVNTSTGEVTFEKGDELQIVSDGKYLGSVSKDTDNGPFTGTITTPVEGLPMYIYYLGVHNKHHSTIKSGATSCKVDITDQTSKLPVISCGRTDNYSSTTSSYTVKLLNKCALVKFNVTTSAESEATCLTGLNNEMIIDFTTNTFTPDTVGDCVIKLAAGSGERWAILLPNTAESGAKKAYSADYRYAGTRSAVGAINNNDFITTGYAVTIETATTDNPTYDGKKFSLSETKRVEFAPGNVQHVKVGDNWVWRFAEHQYSVLKNENTQRYEGACDRDRFGWGTGGNNLTNGAYPDNVSASNNDYPQSTSEYVDWGTNFATDEGHGAWHAPKCVEWKYLMFYRPATELNGVYNARYARARVNEVNGIILFPDVYNHPDPEVVPLPAKVSINYTTNGSSGQYTYNDNIYTEEQWNLMQANGAVFLPLTGERVIVSQDAWGNNTLGFQEVGTQGHYWSQCDLGQPKLACNMYFTDYRVYVKDDNDKYKGFAVRLVRE